MCQGLFSYNTKGRPRREITDKLALAEMKNISVRDSVKRMRRKPRTGRKCLQKTSNKGLLLKIDNDLLTLNNTKTNYPIKK